MPVRQPFTLLCQRAAQGRQTGRADLHVHTTFSDGSYTPAQVVALARRCGLAAVAITDHDTLHGVPVAQAAAVGGNLEVIPGVEITTEHQGRELHLLAFFVTLTHGPLQDALEKIRQRRAERFGEMLERLRRLGVSIPYEANHDTTAALGRRHLAMLLVQQGRAANVREAFHRYLGDTGPVAVPKTCLPVAEALALVRAADGVAAWAHPAYDCHQASLAQLRDLGLGALEVEYPDRSRARNRELRGWAATLGLAVCGGSDCHGPGRRAIGSCTINAAELEQLRARRVAGVPERGE